MSKVTITARKRKDRTWYIVADKKWVCAGLRRDEVAMYLQYYREQYARGYLK